MSMFLHKRADVQDGYIWFDYDFQNELDLMTNIYIFVLKEEVSLTLDSS